MIQMLKITKKSPNQLPQIRFKKNFEKRFENFVVKRPK